jgi:hypothetical protein
MNLIEQNSFVANHVKLIFFFWQSLISEIIFYQTLCTVSNAMLRLRDEKRMQHRHRKTF